MYAIRSYYADTFAYDMNLDETVMELEERAKEGMKKMEAFFEKKNNALGENKVVYKTKLLRGVAEDEIVRYSNEYQPIAIVMGTRGLDRKVSDLVGSVTAEVMENAKFRITSYNVCYTKLLRDRRKHFDAYCFIVHLSTDEGNKISEPSQKSFALHRTYCI